MTSFSIIRRPKMGILHVLLFISSVCLAKGASCKTGYSSYGEYCYALLQLQASWAEAQLYCKALGGSLAVIEDVDESSFVEGMLRQKHGNISTGQIWIGGTDLLQEGVWVAPETLEPLTFFNWAKGEPDNLGGQHCLAIFNSASLDWDDNLCEVHNYALCDLLVVHRKGVPRILREISAIKYRQDFTFYVMNIHDVAYEMKLPE